jgi:hypothetical protein
MSQKLQQGSLVNITAPAWIEIQDWDGCDWQLLKCDGCGEGWERPDDEAKLMTDPATDKVYLRHLGDCEDLLREKVARTPGMPSTLDQRPD